MAEDCVDRQRRDFVFAQHDLEPPLRDMIADLPGRRVHQTRSGDGGSDNRVESVRTHPCRHLHANGPAPAAETPLISRLREHQTIMVCQLCGSVWFTMPLK